MSRRKSHNERQARREVRLREAFIVPDVDQAVAGLESYACPDCDSERGRVVRRASNVVSVEVHHDDSCPWLAGRTR